MGRELQLTALALTKLQKDKQFQQVALSVYALKGVKEGISFVERRLRVEHVSEQMAYVCAAAWMLGAQSLQTWAESEEGKKNG